jgi:hypothetical protein
LHIQELEYKGTLERWKKEENISRETEDEGDQDQNSPVEAKDPFQISEEQIREIQPFSSLLQFGFEGNVVHHAPDLSTSS